MDRHYKTSPFIKTAFVAIALAASSMSSAAHAEDFLARFSTQGLSELSLDANPQIIETLQNLERGICPDPALLRYLINELSGTMERNHKKWQTAFDEVEKARTKLRDLEAQITKKEAEIRAAEGDAKEKLKEELKELQAERGYMKSALQEHTETMNRLSAKGKADKAAFDDLIELLKRHCPEEEKDSKKQAQQH